jgi:hypothetical protein
MVIVGNICLLVAIGRRISARPGIVPFMPLMRSHPKVVYLLCRQFPLDILRQDVGLSNVRKDMIPATVTTAQFTGWNDAVFAAQPIQSACSRFIHGHVRVPDEILLRCNWDIGSEFISAYIEIAILNQVHHSPFFRRNFNPLQFIRTAKPTGSIPLGVPQTTGTLESLLRPARKSGNQRTSEYILCQQVGQEKKHLQRAILDYWCLLFLYKIHYGREIFQFESRSLHSAEFTLSIVEWTSVEMTTLYKNNSRNFLAFYENVCKIYNKIAIEHRKQETGHR